MNDHVLSLSCRFKRLGEASDLDEAISRQWDAVKFPPDDHPNKAICLINHGNSFISRFGRLREIGDLEAISRQRDAIDLTPDDHPDEARYLGHLGNSSLARYEHLGEISDLEEGIWRQRDAVDCIPDRRPD